jgi:hypothetical protein
VTQVEPTARKNSLQLLLVDLLGEKDLTVQEPPLGIHESLHLIDRGRVHRVPAPRTICQYHRFFNKSKSKEQLNSFWVLVLMIRCLMLKNNRRISSKIDFIT